ncbi:MAG: biopolymer transporter Tol, partial [Bdellovibrionaceae bacterium]|nr:biopolymer transporter Tol [Pseudobdellovibrionaceae bacterium]
MSSFLILMGAVLTFNLIQNGQAAETQSGTQSKEALFSDTRNTLVTNTKQITFVGPRSGEGYFSADGKKMIYQSEREAGNPFYQMFILDFDTGKSTRVSTGTGMTTCGWVHPKLNKVMWSSTHLDPKFKEKVQTEMTERAQPVKKRYSWSYDDQYDIFESDLNGHKIKRLTKELGYDAEGSYSPDGKSIAFASNRSQYTKEYSAEEKKLIERDASYAMDIYIMNADGTNVRRLTNTKGYDGGPFFSADGQKITWRRFTPDGSRAEIYTMNTDGSDQQQVTRLNAMSWAPFFHPSGQYIVFTSSILGYTNFELFIVDTAGTSKPVRVTFEEGFDGLPAFSPDGKKLSWTRRNEKGESQIYLADWNHDEALKLLGQSSNAPKMTLNLSPAIDEKDTRQIVSYLASDEFKGRRTGSAEERIYTDKIAELFKAWGLKPALGQSLIHNFEFTSEVKAGEKNSLTLNGRYEKELVRGTDYQISSFSKSG